MGKLLYGCVLTSLAVSRASALILLLPLLCGRKGWITPSSKSLFHLHPITPSSGEGAKEQHKQTAHLFIHPIPPLFLSSSSLSPPLHFSETLLVLHDPRAQEFLQFPISDVYPSLCLFLYVCACKSGCMVARGVWIRCHGDKQHEK